MTRTLLTTAALAALVVVVLLLLVWWGQERMVFQPPMFEAMDTSGATRLDFVGDDGMPLFAYAVRPAGAGSDASPTVIHFHGNAEVAAWAIPWARELSRRTGATVLLAEYRGYAGQDGAPSYATARSDALALWRIARDTLGATAAATIVHGFSLGSGIATELAREIQPHALVLEAPFTSAEDMAARIGPFLRGPLWRLIARVHYDTRAAVSILDVPVWVAHGSADRVVPQRMGYAVFAAARRKGELLPVPGAGHNDLRLATDYWAWLVRAVTAP